jgi:hypothetical protein
MHVRHLLPLQEEEEECVCVRVWQGKGGVVCELGGRQEREVGDV